MSKYPNYKDQKKIHVPERLLKNRLLNGNVGNYTIISLSLARNNFDIIIASSPPLTIGILGLILSKIYKIPWILDIRDIWPDVAVEAGMLKENGFVDRLSKKLANYLYNHATHLTPVTESKLTKIKRVGIPINRMSIVSNGVDFDLINNAKQKNWRSEL